MRHKIDKNKFIGIAKSDIQKEYIKVNCEEKLYTNQAIGDFDNNVFLIVNENGTYTLLGELDEYLEKEYLENTIFEVASGRFI